MNAKQIIVTATAPTGFDWDTVKAILGGLNPGHP